MKEVLILVVVQIFVTFLFLFLLSAIKKLKVSSNIGWLIIASMVVILNRIGEYFGYDSVTIGAEDFIFILLLIPGYFFAKRKGLLP